MTKLEEKLKTLKSLMNEAHRINDLISKESSLVNLSLIGRPDIKIGSVLRIGDFCNHTSHPDMKCMIESINIDSAHLMYIDIVYTKFKKDGDKYAFSNKTFMFIPKENINE